MEEWVKGNRQCLPPSRPPCPLLHPCLTCTPAAISALCPDRLLPLLLSYTQDRPCWPGKWPLGGGGSELTCPPLPTLPWWDAAPALSPARRRGPPAPAETGRWVCLVPELGFTAHWAHRRPHPLKPWPGTEELLGATSVLPLTLLLAGDEVALLMGPPPWTAWLCPLPASHHPTSGLHSEPGAGELRPRPRSLRPHLKSQGWGLLPLDTGSGLHQGQGPRAAPEAGTVGP